MSVIRLALMFLVAVTTPLRAAEPTSGGDNASRSGTVYAIVDVVSAIEVEGGYVVRLKFMPYLASGPNEDRRLRSLIESSEYRLNISNLPTSLRF